MTPADRSIAAAVDEVVRDVPGVSSLYRSGRLLGRLIAAGKESLSAEGDPDAPYALVGVAGGRTEVVITVGITADSATEVCRDVHDGIAAWLRERGYTDASITVTVAYVAA